MPRFLWILCIFLVAGTTMSFNQQLHCCSSQSTNGKKYSIISTARDNGGPSSRFDLIKRMRPRRFDPVTVLNHGQKYHCCVLLVLLGDPLPVMAESATSLYVEKYNFVQNLLLAFLPGLPMILTFIVLIIFSFSSFKQELKSEMKVDLAYR
jgi:hypothetical protein